MTQENKQLLLVDLSARLPYGVKVKITSRESKNRIVHLTEDNICHLTNGWRSECKPCLFPMSSMTEWQERELEILMKNSIESCGMLSPYDCLEMERFFNENHLDWRGLIPKGLAIDCTNLNIY